MNENPLRTQRHDLRLPVQILIKLCTVIAIKCSGVNASHIMNVTIDSNIYIADNIQKVSAKGLFTITCWGPHANEKSLETFRSPNFLTIPPFMT